MAEDHKPGSMDIETQEKTFDAFMSFTTYAVVAIIVLIILMALFIT
ncbi:MAG: aa3-type cytochrome c oxidase subunit IV [Pseudomonadota bacterium]